MSQINNILIYVIISNLQWWWTLVIIQSSKLNMDSLFISEDLSFMIMLDEKLYSKELVGIFTWHDSSPLHVEMVSES